ncbi:protein transporter Sec31 [Streptomyces sp. NPDC057257]|uniref:protein transporter Sec31 n=1 Tax=Streptomyces sp. NPDC057257 TaxID=3346071 RepID=UPI0036257941
MKTRRIERTRLVPHTVDGETEMVLDTEILEVPAPPADWDQRVRTAVTAGAAILVTASLVWTTTSVGELLSRSTVAAVAYTAGVAFDASWILCMGAEWLLRYDPDRAALPRRAGHAALAVSMGAVYANGHLSGEWTVGAVGAAVSALAKGGWMIAMRVHARPLDARTQQWVAKRRASVDGQLALIPIRRELQRGQAMVDAEQRSLVSPDRGSADPDQSRLDPQSGSASPLPTLAGPMTVKDAVRTAKDSGITDPDAVLRYVHQVADANAKADTVNRYLRGA